MRHVKAILAGAAASIGIAATAQEPAAPPAPVIPLTPAATATTMATPPAPGPASVPPAAPGAAGACTPDHCFHRWAIARWRCRRHLQDVFLGYPEEFERPALGATVHNINAVSIGNAEAASMILRSFDFESGTAKLNLRGGDKLREIGMRLPATFSPLIIERTDNPALDAARRSAVLTLLGSGPFPIPPERVIVGPSLSRGLNGTEALIIDGTELKRTETTGPLIGTGADDSSSGRAR